MKMKTRINIIKYIFAFLSISVFSPFLFAVSQKKVLVMTIKNTARDPNYNYLEPSITDAIIEKLKENFVFENFEEKDWKLLAKNNFFFEDSYHTPTIGMQLGLLGNQDVVIGGGFTIENQKIITKVHILGMAEKKIIKQFNITGFADNRIWDSVAEIATTIAEAAKDVLPNEEEWSSVAIQGINQLGISVSLSPLAFPAGRSEPLPSLQSFSVNPNDFSILFGFSADYARMDVFLDNLAAWGSLSYLMSTQEFEAENHSPDISTVHATLDSFHLKGGFGYKAYTLRSFYVIPRLGAGFYVGSLVVDFSTLNVAPSSPAGDSDLSVIEGYVTGISADAGLILGYQFLPYLTAELKNEFSHIFLESSSFSNYFFSLGLAAKF